MQPSTPFDWGRVMTPLRWLTRILGVVPYVALVWFTIAAAVGGPGSSIYPTVGWWVFLGIMGVALAVAIFWTGIGELIGGVILAGAGVYLVVNSGFQFGGFVAAALPLLAGLLFIVCGWYTVTQRSRRATLTNA